MTDAGPRRTSIRSIDQVSKGKVRPTPPYWRMPSYKRMTEVVSVNPRADSELPPLPGCPMALMPPARSEEHTSELQSLMRISYAAFCLKKKKDQYTKTRKSNHNSTTITACPSYNNHKKTKQ